MGYVKTKLPVIIGVTAFVVLCGLAFYFLEFHQEIYYTQIDNTKIEKLSSSDMPYKYTLDCYDESGHKKTLSFKTSRELKNNAYLKLEVMTTGVHAWEEINYDELPSKVKTKYN